MRTKGKETKRKSTKPIPAVVPTRIAGKEETTVAIPARSVARTAVNRKGVGS